MKLLLAIDPTDSSAEVVSHVASRPWPQGAIARAFTVIEYAAVPSEVWKAADGRMEFVRREMLRRAEAVVSRAADELGAAGLKAEAVVRIGDPRLDIVEAASEWAADFIFVRSHIFRSLTRWLMGSVSKTVLRDAPCSVGIVRGSPEDAARYKESGMKILLATDGSECSDAAARSVAARPWPPNSEVRVISVADPLTFSVEAEYGSIEEFDSRQEGSMTRAERAVRDAMKVIGGAGLKTAGATLSSYPKASIVDEAKEWGADLVVVGSHGWRGIDRILVGSVSEAVALHAHCSVEVIRDRALCGREV